MIVPHGHGRRMFPSGRAPRTSNAGTDFVIENAVLRSGPAVFPIANAVRETLSVARHFCVSMGVVVLAFLMPNANHPRIIRTRSVFLIRRCLGLSSVMVLLHIRWAFLHGGHFLNRRNSAFNPEQKFRQRRTYKIVSDSVTVFFPTPTSPPCPSETCTLISSCFPSNSLIFFPPVSS